MLWLVVPSPLAGVPGTEVATRMTQDGRAAGEATAAEAGYAPLRRSFATVLSVLFGAGILNVAHGLLSTYLPLRLAAAGFAASDVGMMAAGFSLGFIAGCLTVPRMIARVGHIRVFAAAAALASAATLAFPISLDPILWMGLRAVHGLATAALFTVMESWLNDRAPSVHRGTVMAVYIIVGRLAVIAGQFALFAGEIEGLLYLMLGSAAYSLCLIPMAVTRAPTPKVPRVATMNLAAFYRLAPAAAIGVFCVGLINSAVINLGPVYVIGIGLSAGEVAAAIAALQFGGLVLQWPVGWLSDRLDRRLVIAASAVVVAGLSVLIAVVGPSDRPLVVVLFALWGAAALSVFAVLIAHANDRVRSEDRVALASTLLLTWAVGSVLGPPVASAFMDWQGPDALFYYAATVALAMAAFVAWRMTRRAPRPAEARPRFVNIHATSPQLSKLDPRTADSADAADADAADPAQR